MVALSLEAWKGRDSPALSLQMALESFSGCSVVVETSAAGAAAAAAAAAVVAEKTSWVPRLADISRLRAGMAMVMNLL